MTRGLIALALVSGAIMLALSLSGCREQATPAGPAPAADNPLEQAARDANLVVDAESTAPTGLYERRHAAGRDALCLRPDNAGGYRFGIIASFGTNLTCEGQGKATQDGERLRLSFEMPRNVPPGGAACTITARYDGQSVRLPGTVVADCSALCGPRASLSGVAVERVGWTEVDAQRLLSRPADGAGVPLCR